MVRLYLSVKKDLIPMNGIPKGLCSFDIVQGYAGLQVGTTKKGREGKGPKSPTYSLAQKKKFLPQYGTKC